MQPVIETWLATIPELDRIKQLGEAAVDAWWESLTPEQRRVFSLLVQNGYLYQLQGKTYAQRALSDDAVLKRY